MPREKVRTREARRSNRPTSCKSGLHGRRHWEFLEAREEREIFFGGEFVVDHGGVGDETGGDSWLARWTHPASAAEK